MGDGETTGTGWALLIGIDDYENASRLKFARADVRALGRVLVERCGYPEEQVRLLVDEGPRRGQTTHGGMVEALEAMACLVRPEDVFLFYFAGHGIVRDGEGYLLGVDARIGSPRQLALTSVPLAILRDALGDIQAGRKVLILDACRNAPEAARAGEANLLAAGLRDGFRDVALARRPAGETPPTPGAAAFLFACDVGERAYEWPEAGHSVFNHFLVESLGEAAADPGGEIEFGRVADEVQRRVARWSRERPAQAQRPVFELRGAARVVMGRRPAPPATPAAEPARVPAQSPPEGAPPAGRPPVPLAEAGGAGTREPASARAEAGGPAGRERADPGSGAVLVWVPPGSFVMGSPPGEPGRGDDEGPPHRVTVSRGFWLGKYPVTQGQWEAVMGANPSSFAEAGPEAPVERVSWAECREFLRRLGERSGGAAYRLPTEAEWEYACRAGSAEALYAGPPCPRGEYDDPGVDAVAWYGGNSGVSYEGGWDSALWPEKQYPHRRAGTHAVGRKQPNAWGLHDMLGNVYEWCADGARTYTQDPATDPLGPEAGPRAIRGGSWSSPARGVRCAVRLTYAPGGRSGNLGFRLVRSGD